MSATINSRYSPAPNFRVAHGNVVLDTAYPAGGYPFSAASVGLDHVDKVLFTPRLDGLVPTFDVVNKKLKVLDSRFAVPRIKMKAIAGGAAGSLTCAGINIGSNLLSVIQFENETVGNAIETLTATGSIGPWKVLVKDAIDNTGGGTTTGDSLLVTWTDSPVPSGFHITAFAGGAAGDITGVPFLRNSTAVLIGAVVVQNATGLVTDLTANLTIDSDATDGTVTTVTTDTTSGSIIMAWWDLGEATAAVGGALEVGQFLAVNAPVQMGVIPGAAAGAHAVAPGSGYVITANDVLVEAVKVPHTAVVLVDLTADTGSVLTAGGWSNIGGTTLANDSGILFVQPNGAVGSFLEVPNGQNLATITFDFVAFQFEDSGV